jgi:hypothetical protein
LCVVAAAALVMSQRSKVVNWIAEVDASGEITRLERVDAFAPSETTAVAKLEPAPARDVRSAAEASMMTASLRDSGEDAVSPAGSSSLVNQAGEIASAGPATISGCLERNESGFFLTDVSGDEAPKSRSWKSGFLRKRAQPVALNDRGSRLASHLGQRIETTGMLEDREMRVRSVRVLGACD